VTEQTIARLHRNVQFIYEQALAEQELESFGVESFSRDRRDPWIFKFNGHGDADGLLSRSAYFAAVNDEDSVYKKLILPAYQGGRFNITRSVNQYLTHWIYPYKGKFHPQMVRALLNILGLRPGHRVLDPFVGSGTTALESMLLGIDVVGIDISPLCVLISKVKTSAWKHCREIAEYVELGTRPGQDCAQYVRDFFVLADMVTESDVAVRKRDKESSHRKNLTRMLKSITDMATAKEELGLDFGSVSVVEGTIHNMDKVGIEDSSVDAVVTSPPYSIALDYVKNDAHALRAMGYDTRSIRERFIGVRGRRSERFELYNQDMQLAFKEIARVLRSGAIAVVVIGDVSDGKEVTTTEDMKSWGEPFGLRYDREMRKIVFGLYNVITDEKLLFFRKD